MNDARSDTFIAPLGSAREGTLELRRATSIAVRAAPIDELCRGTFERPAPRTQVDGGRVRLEYPRFSLASLLRRSSPGAEIVLNAARPWSVAIVGGLGESTLDLAAVDLRALELEGGVSGVRLVLPPPRGRAGVRITGGASDVTFLRPADIPVVLRVDGGASRLEFDGERYGAIGGETRLETPGAGSQLDRYEIEVVGGSTRLTVAQNRAVP